MSHAENLVAWKKAIEGIQSAFSDMVEVIVKDVEIKEIIQNDPFELSKLAPEGLVVYCWAGYEVVDKIKKRKSLLSAMKNLKQKLSKSLKPENMTNDIDANFIANHVKQNDT